MCTKQILMRITNDQPVDVAALRQEWIKVVDRWAYLGTLDKKTQRVAQSCCWENIIEDIRRYDRITRVRLMSELFEDVMFALDLDTQIQWATTERAATWLEEQLGVKLEGD